MTVRLTPVTPLPRQFPHVDNVTDWRAQQSLRLLWDRVFSLEERLQAAQATLGDLVQAANAQEDRLAGLQRVAGEALAIAQRAAGDSASGGGGGSGASNEFGLIGKGSAPPTVSLPDLYGTVADYADAHPTELENSCHSAPGGNWDFMDGVVAALQAVDPRVGYNGKRGNTSDLSHDAISYYHGILPPVEGSHDVYVIDIIGGHCPGPDDPPAAPAWINVTTSTEFGAWVSSR